MAYLRIPTISGSNLCPDEKGTESGALGNLPAIAPADRPVATYAPMKRGLKVRLSKAEAIHYFRILGSNLCPDEKGTERLNYLTNDRVENALVATYAPMKRGLKVQCLTDSMSEINLSRCSNLCPDEKGTERFQIIG